MTVRRPSTPSPGLSTKSRREVLTVLVALATVGLAVPATVAAMWSAFKPAPETAKAVAAPAPGCGSAKNTIMIGGGVTGSTIRIDNDASC